MPFYSDSQREIQQRYDSSALAQRLEEAIVSDEIAEDHEQFIASRDFFFLSTVNGNGEPTVSYKGGDVGIVTVLDPRTVLFPIYDGNGMFLSAGNIQESAKIGMLFIDFETPNRVRVQATAELTEDPELMAHYPGALMVVKAAVDQVFLNCARYIHKHQRLSTSPYVPEEDGAQPHPSWKRIDMLQDVLPAEDQSRADDEGGLITIEEYAEKLAAGES